MREIKKVKFFFWKLFHPASLFGKVTEKTWYFRIGKKLYKVVLRTEEFEKINYHWEVKGPGGGLIFDKDLEDYLIKKAQEDLRKEKNMREVRG